MVVSVTALLGALPDPSPAQIADALDGNLCRCTGYVNIVRAVHHAAGLLRGERPEPAAGVDLAEPLARAEVGAAPTTEADVEVV
jgi:carbon-monoxide dehydrogenase small subunit